MSIGCKYPAKAFRAFDLFIIGLKYLPFYVENGLIFMLDVLARRMELLDMSEVIKFNVPRYREFTLESVLDEVKNGENFMSYLPDISAMNRKHNCSICSQLLFQASSPIKYRCWANIQTQSGSKLQGCLKTLNH